MFFNLKTEKSAEEIAKSIGYKIIGQMDSVARESVEYTLEKRLGDKDYPQFGLYIDKKGDECTFTLHFHKVKPADEAPHDGPAGEYSGSEVEKEINRIKEILK